MSTLYIRDVPDEVAKSLKARAAASGLSLNSLVNAELARLAAAPSNAELLERLRERTPAQGPGRIDIVAAVHHERRRSWLMPRRWWRRW
jgi:plasmid stability protein